MNKVVSMEELVPLMEEKINNNGEVVFTPKGISMLPMLRNGRDVVTLGKAEFPIKKYQVAFYKRDNGQYVLHRIVKLESGSYVMRGDNQFSNESGIREDQVIGVVKAFTRKGISYSCDNKKYILYYKIWCNTVGIRKCLKVARWFAGKAKRKILRIFK